MKDNIKMFKEATDYLIDAFNCLTLKEIISNGNQVVNDFQRIEDLLNAFNTKIKVEKTETKTETEIPVKKFRGAKVKIIDFLRKNGASYGSKIAKSLNLSNPYMDLKELETYGITEKTYKENSHRVLWKLKSNSSFI
jgi:hypothetical protein